MSNKNINTNITINGEIKANVYDVSSMKKNMPSWNSLSQKEKYELLELESPLKTIQSCNVTTTGLHEYMVRNLHRNKTSDADNVSITHAGIGDDAESGISPTNTNLNNLTTSKEVLDQATNGKTLKTTFLLESNESNQKNINEIGVASGDLNAINNNDIFLINHASFTEIQKNNNNSVTFTIELTFDNA